MTITREQVADLRAGDVVEVRDPQWGEGTVLKGRVRDESGTLYVGDRRLNNFGFAVNQEVRLISRPLYVNHDRTELVPGDVVRDADSGHNGVWLCTLPSTSRSWAGSDDRYHTRGELPDRLHLLVDGTTGQVVP